MTTQSIEKGKKRLLLTRNHTTSPTLLKSEMVGPLIELSHRLGHKELNIAGSFIVLKLVLVWDICIYSLRHSNNEYYLVSIHSFISTKLAPQESLTIKHRIKQDLLHSPHRKFNNHKN